MVSWEEKRATLHEKLQILRSVTNSHAVRQTSIIVDATKYIQELKRKVEKLNQDIACASSITVDDTLPMVTVETLEKGFLITVFSEKSCPGLLVCILEAFEELRLDVLDTRVSCTDIFRLEAVGESGGQAESVDAQVVRQAVLQAFKKSREINQQK